MKKKLSINSGLPVPQSFVTKGRQRLKQYTDTVYLNNGDEFEIELYNPTSNKVLAKIDLNGKSIGNGIVLRPGERIHLERYLDESKKFLFETYTIDGNDEEVQQAVMKNGLVGVKFFNEQLQTPNIHYMGSTTVSNFGSYYIPTYTCTGGITSLATSNVNTSFSANSIVTSTPTVGFDVTYSNQNKSKLLETGRVEKGSSSDQSFTYDSTTFNMYVSYANTWKILPNSQKVMVKEELITYCGSCGSKRKKDSHKFCPQCGTKF